MATNSVVVIVPPHCQGEVSAVSNSTCIQKAKIKLEHITRTFIGTGEGASMTLDGNSARTLPFYSEAYHRQCTLFFQSHDPPGPWQNSAVTDPVLGNDGPFVTVTVTAKNHDSNNTVLTICYSYVSSATVPKSVLMNITSSDTDAAETPPATSAVITDDTKLQLHGKTYYNNPNIQGGDEAYILLNISEAGFGGDHQIYGSAQSTGFASAIVNAWDMRLENPVWNWIQVHVTFTDCRHPGMEQSYLTLTTWFRYVFSPPTTYTRPDWTAELYGTPYKIVEVTA